MMFLPLIVMSMVFGSICAVQRVPYVEIYKNILEVKKDIERNVLTLDNNVVHLNDSRRHYVEITHVVYSVAYERGVSCVLRTYEDVLEQAAPEIISEPQKAVIIAKQLAQDLKAKTSEIQKLINTILSLGVSDEVADKLIDEIVHNNPKEYKKEAKLHFALGKAAAEFLKKREIFNKVSNNLVAHTYVIKRSEDLNNLIDALTSVIKIMYRGLMKC